MQTQKWNQKNTISFVLGIIKLSKCLQQFNQVIIIMGVYNGDNKIVISVTKDSLFHLDLPKIVGINLKHEIGYLW